MAVNTIQIKRSISGGSPASLLEGELAYSYVNGNLYIGAPGSTIQSIGGNADHLKLAGIEAGAQVNTVHSVNSMVGNVIITAANIGLGNVDNTSDANKPISTATQTALNLKANIANPTFTGNVTLAHDPVTDLEAATKIYVDTVAAGLHVKESVVTASSAPGTFATDFANGSTVGGVVVTTGQRILIKDQADATTNGIYDVQASGAPVRSSDANTNAKVTAGMFTFVQSGTYAGEQWVLVTPDPIVLGTTNLTFSQFSTPTTYTAGTGIDITSFVISVNGNVLLNTSSLNAANLTGNASAIGGANIMYLNGSHITSGTVGDSFLSANILTTSSTIDCGYYA